MAHPYEYIGCFVPLERLEPVTRAIGGTRLARVVQNPHVTFQYAPEQVDESLFGEKVHIRVVGYGKDGENEGLKVEVSAQERRLEELIHRIPVPHITLSISVSGAAVNTRYLNFDPVAPVELIGVFGGWRWDGRLVLGPEHGSHGPV